MSRQSVVVVVEDEPIQRMAAVTAFTDGGFETADFDNATDAAAFVRNNQETVLAVFTDVRMPGDMDGINLVAQIAFESPNIGLLVTSGQAQGVVERLPPNGYFVPKPWIATELAAALEHVRPRQSAIA